MYEKKGWKSITFQAPLDIVEALDRIKKQQIRGKGDIIVEALRQFLQEQEETKAPQPKHRARV